MIGLIPSGRRAQATANSTVTVVGPAGLEVGDEMWQHLAVAAELEAQPATQPQVVIEMLGQGAHDAAPVGQGRAIVRSRSTSTRA